MGSNHVVGIDGGATRTRYLLADREGKILLRREGRGSLLGVGRDAEIAGEIENHVREMAFTLGIELPIAALCSGHAGSAGRPEGTRQFREVVQASGVAREVVILSDAVVAFEDAFGEREGILLVAGTGSIALARRAGGELERIGGWGALLADEGSAYSIALTGIRGAIRGEEGRGDFTLLTAAVLRALDVDSLRGILEWSQGAEKGEIAALARLVFEAAGAGDPLAVRIVEGALEGILEHARALRGRLFSERLREPGPTPIRVALVGGIIEEGGPLHLHLTQRLVADGFEIVSGPVDPARGAVQVALGITK